DPEDVEEVARDVEGADGPDVVSGETGLHVLEVGAPGEDSGQRLMAALDLLPERAGKRRVAGVGDAHASVAADDADVRELFWVRDGKAPQADFVEQLEDGGVR